MKNLEEMCIVTLPAHSQSPQALLIAHPIPAWKGKGGIPDLGKPPFQKSAVFFNIVQKAFHPPPLLFEHLSYFAGGVFSCGEFF